MHQSGKKRVDWPFYLYAAGFMLPVIVQQIVASIFNFIDNFMVGTLGAASLAGVSVANKPYTVFMCLFFGLTGAGCILISQYFGAKDEKTTQQVFAVQSIGSLILGTLFFVILALFPREINPEIPRGLEDITVKAMAKNPARRYQSAGEMLDDLGRFVDNPAIVFGYTQAESAARKKTRPAAGKDAGGAKKSGRFAFLPGRGTPGQKASALSVLFGVTCAFVVGTIVFVIIMLAINRPFAKVPEVDMPNLIGQSYDSVRNDRAYSQFSFEVVSQEFNTHYEKGVIFEQDPTSGKRVKEGITIKVKVSTGAQTVILPDFTDEEATLTYAKLTELGLLYTYQEEFSNTAAEGHVIRTDPGKNETVAAGSTVTVYVSKGSGKPKVVVPDLVGQDISYAKDLAAERDLVLSIKYEASIMDPGTVLSQAPGYPAQVDSGSTVYVTVASDETIETSSTSIYVWMPQSIDEDMVLTVELDGDEVYRQTVVPADQRVIKVPLTGEGISMASSYLNGKLLQVNEVNFDDGTSPRIEDHSADFE